MIMISPTRSSSRSGTATPSRASASVEAAWAIVQPILETSTPLYEYDPGSWGPAEAAQLAANAGAGTVRCVWSRPHDDA
jgi:glucose-6-phosphate 1-dehydrogenase